MQQDIQHLSLLLFLFLSQICSRTYLMPVHNSLFALKDPKTSENDDQTNKPITSSKTVSDLEKAKSRAERFGVVTSNTDEKKAARAARFGISNNSKKIGKPKQ